MEERPARLGDDVISTDPALDEVKVWRGIDMRHWSAFLHNDKYYLDQIQQLQRGERGQFNWAAFFLTLPWMFFRKMILVPMAYVSLLLAEATIEQIIFYFVEVDGNIQSILDNAISIAVSVAFGLFANQVYLWHAKRQINEVLTKHSVYLNEATPGMEQEVNIALAKKGGTSWWAVILSILAIVGIAALFFVFSDLLDVGGF